MKWITFGTREYWTLMAVVAAFLDGAIIGRWYL